MESFGPALQDADEIILTDIYAAGEDPIPGITIDVFAEAVRRGSGRPVHVARHLDEVVPAVMRVVRSGDAVITLGAGSIGSLPTRIIDALRSEGGNG
jgi:UDP-N-acetylmuramate--alanine ligase